MNCPKTFDILSKWRNFAKSGQTAASMWYITNVMKAVNLMVSGVTFYSNNPSLNPAFIQ